jgi:SAM-dependent methyltransferase
MLQQHSSPSLFADTDMDNSSNIACTAGFDVHASDYETLLDHGLLPTGFPKDYFAHGRIAWLGRLLKHLKFKPDVIIDYGCGTGTSSLILLQMLGAQRVIGLDISGRSLAKARQRHNLLELRFVLRDEIETAPEASLVFCNGVFHHIAPHDRRFTVRDIFELLRPGGIFALWENNPWNPGTRYVMNRIPFDKDARTLSPLKTKRLLRRGGFKILDQSFVFFFPKILRSLLFVEPFLRWLPLGGQYLTLGRKQ